MVILKELFIGLATIVLLLLVSNAFLGPDQLTTTSLAAAPAQERANVTPQERINAVFDQFAGKKSRARINQALNPLGPGPNRPGSDHLPLHRI